MEKGDRMDAIFVVEDEDVIREELVQLLEHAGYRARAVQDFGQMLVEIRDFAPDMILLDVNLPGLNGTYVCRQIRKEFDLPVIFVTGRNTTMDELECMMAGGDDYVAKPYHGPILLARIQAVLKRTKKQMEHQPETELSCENVTLHLTNSSISGPLGETELTKNEFRICRCLFAHSGQIVSRTALIEDLWENEIFIDDNTLSVNVTRLRAKLQQIGAGDLIRTRRGQGYIV